MHTLQKSSPPSNRRAIFKINIRINSIVPAIDVAMAPNSASALRKSIKTALDNKSLLHHAAKNRCR
jgi:hypothetical protein